MNKRVALLTALLIAFGISDSFADEAKKGTADAKQTQVTTKPGVAKVTTDAAVKRTPVRNAKNQIATLVTNHGNLTLELYRDVAPGHADSFAARVADGFYDSLIFHRIIDGFMIQGGDPTGTGMGDAGYRLKAEFNNLPHVMGTLSMARSSDPNSASCQFFICLGTTKSLDGQYTVFGHLLKGYDVLQKLGKVETVMSSSGEKSKPKETVRIIRAYLSDAEGKALASK